MLRRAASALDRVWPWPPLALLGAAALVALGSIVLAPGPSDAAQVRELTSEFGQAAGTNDGDRMCELMAPVLRRSYDGRFPGTSCQRFTRTWGVGVPGGQLRDAPRDAPALSGERATIEAPSIGVRFVAVRAGEEWRLAGLERFPARAAPPPAQG